MENRPGDRVSAVLDDAGKRLRRGLNALAADGRKGVDEVGKLGGVEVAHLKVPGLCPVGRPVGEVADDALADDAVGFFAAVFVWFMRSKGDERGRLAFGVQDAEADVGCSLLETHGGAHAIPVVTAAYPMQGAAEKCRCTTSILPDSGPPCHSAAGPSRG